MNLQVMVITYSNVVDDTETLMRKIREIFYVSTITRAQGSDDISHI